MSVNFPSKSAKDAAEKILAVIYGEDLLGCKTSPDTLSPIIQQGIDAETEDHKLLAAALIGAIRKIKEVSSPPDRKDVTDIEQLASILGERADAIHEITSKILEAWDKAEHREF